MPITRTPWIDDDGTGTTGTIINNAEKTLLYNQIDAMSMPYHVLTNTEIGTIANWAPAGFDTRNAVIYWYGNGATTINALKAGVDGQLLVIRNRGNYLLQIPHYAGAGAGYGSFINSVGSAPTPIAPEGYAQYVYLAAPNNYWMLIGHEQGGHITVPFNAANFSGSGSMTVTIAAGNRVTSKYRLAGKSLTYTFYLNSVTLGGVLSNVVVISSQEWGGYQPTGSILVPIAINEGGTGILSGYINMEPGNPAQMVKYGGAAYVAGASNFYGSITFEVN
jgi:hypothetical protein